MDYQRQSLKRRALGGSLPFKKRCFRMIEQQLNGSSIPSVLGQKTAFPTKKPQDLPIFTNSFVPGYSDTYPQKIRAAGSAFSAHPQQHGNNSNNTRSASFSDDEDGSTGPRPGRCHGRTGSAQAYCQRLPCYKGSNYCKRHYDQYVTKGSSLPLCRNTSETEDKSSFSRSTQQQQQDKRFSGSKGEIRCKATTTRGRECAYIAVNGTKYCFMHADYDTNPPPRRGGKHAAAASVVVTEPSCSKSKKKEARRSCSNVSDSSSSKSTDRKRRNTAEKLAQKHADSPFPLLSMISSDQWANKRVRVSVGPFEGHIGTVEKWSNGWVGVRIPGVGLHNRRSFELYLDDESMEDLSSEQKKGIMRCVSRDTVTPSPLFQDNKRTPSPKETASTYQPVTPNPTMEDGESRVISKTRSLDGIEMVSLPEVTPIDARGGRACVNSPMIESLLASQEHNTKLDLLFGTAALDRSRRSIRRPKIYQDTEMLDKKQRSRKVSLTMEE